MIKFIILNILLTSSTAWACEISLFEKVVILDKSRLSSDDFFLSENCSIKTKQEITNFLTNTNGNVDLERSITELDGIEEKIQLKSGKIKVSTIEDLFNAQIFADKKFKLLEFKTVPTRASVKLDQSESITINCGACNQAGIFNFVIQQHNTISGQTQKLASNATIGILSKVVVANRNIPSFYKLDIENDLKEVETYVTDPGKYVSKLNDLKFMHAVRPINTGAYVENSAVRPYSLVNTGEQLKVITQFSNISIEGTGISMETGHYGQVIKLRNTKSNTIFTAKIIDKGVARIEL